MYNILFMVFDNQVPKKNATVTRTVTIAEPCPVGEEYCADDRTCSPVRVARVTDLAGNEGLNQGMVSS